MSVGGGEAGCGERCEEGVSVGRCQVSVGGGEAGCGERCEEGVSVGSCPVSVEREMLCECGVGSSEKTFFGNWRLGGSKNLANHLKPTPIAIF